MRRFLLTLALILSFTSARAQTVSAFKACTDSLASLLEKRTSVQNKLVLKKIIKRGDLLDFHYSVSLGDYPWRHEDIGWFRAELKNLFPSAYKSLNVGKIFSNKTELADLATPALTYDGRPTPYRYRYTDRDLSERFVQRKGSREYPKGLSGRNIALWQSHGLHYDAGEDRWSWQRAPLHRTVEDMYTLSYVIPFLMPMLENAGAYVMTPRERDVNRFEAVCDNDAAFQGPRTPEMRRSGSYEESGDWSAAGTGFADFKAVYLRDDNPFRAGTARKAETVAYASEGKSEVKWSFDVDRRSSYAVYVSYKTLPNSTEAARYSVRHLGGTTEFTVNQKMGGSTWIYLGSFEFGPDAKGCVTLDNVTPEGHAYVKGSVVTADAVRIGGGMGKVARGPEGASEAECKSSGMPAFVEGALYSMQWAGVDTCIFNKWDNDYTRDYASRGAWTSMMCYGSPQNPIRTDADAPAYEGKNIPVDLSFALHTDAGSTPNDSIVGTLAIYTLLCEKADTLPDGRKRDIDRTYADYVQTQICNDLRAETDSSWNRRAIWDRSYSESRTTSVPAMLLELLSHQNFADMRYGLDPSFRFTVCRSIYKGMLKFLSEIYGRPYVVQPLPVNSLAVSFGENDKTAVISWRGTEDRLEPTASPTGYILYTRRDDGVFDEGQVVRGFKGVNGKINFNVDITPGHIYSFRVAAFNEGGKSFPSETLCIGIPGTAKSQTVMVVNNFDRVSAPAWFDTPEYAGFQGRLDSGVGYISDLWYIGEDYQHRRDLEWITNDNPGFGATRSDKAGMIVAGNSFDFAYVHGKALMDAGYPFYSVSRDAWMEDNTLSAKAFAMDLICGKQVTVRMGKGFVESRYKVFPEGLQKAIRSFSEAGGHLIVSGANIATDVWDRVFPVEVDAAARKSDQSFVTKVLGYGWGTSFGSDSGSLAKAKGSAFNACAGTDDLHFWNTLNDVCYCVENPDGLKPAQKECIPLLRYEDTGICAAVSYSPGKYKAVSFGFPLETLKDPYAIQRILDSTLSYLKK